MKNVIYGVRGYHLTDEEKGFFRNEQPFGFVLFKRNIDSHEQIQNLTNDLKDCVAHECIIFIDQEGGRVVRIEPPLFNKTYEAEKYSKIYNFDSSMALRASYLNGYIISNQLKKLGINGNFAPVLDLYYEEADNIIGNRSFGTDPEIVAALSLAFHKGSEDANVVTCMKHIPGHGRALVDSHKDLPIITNSIEELNETDFLPFKLLCKDFEFAMTAHIVYECLDKHNCITHSAKAINFIREKLGFKGLLISDDLSMEALSGDLFTRASKASEAGIDILLHCNGKLDEMEQVARATIEVNFNYELKDREIDNKFNEYYSEHQQIIENQNFAIT